MVTRRFAGTWWGRAWTRALEDRGSLDPSRLPRGRTYARQGAVHDIEVEPGLIRSKVTGRQPEPYRVSIGVRPFTPDEWDTTVTLLAGRAAHLAALFDGELPTEVVDELSEAGVELLPVAGDLLPECSCPDWADPCKHAAATCYLVADVIDADPFTLFLLRGRDRDTLLRGVRDHRSTIRTGEPGAPDPPPDGADGGADGGPEEGRLSVTELLRRPAQPLSAHTLPPLPRQPLRAVRPRWEPGDPPPDSGVERTDVWWLACDAAERALTLCNGDGDSGLDLTHTADLARRAAGARASDLGLLGPEQRGPTLDELAERSGHDPGHLRVLGAAWHWGGRDGLRILEERWTPPEEQLSHGRELAPPGARVRDNTVTSDGVQWRLDRQGRWWPFEADPELGWVPSGPPEDPDAGDQLDVADQLDTGDRTHRGERPGN